MIVYNAIETTGRELLIVVNLIVRACAGVSPREALLALFPVAAEIRVEFQKLVLAGAGLGLDGIVAAGQPHQHAERSRN
jgi:hypothetical protein